MCKINQFDIAYIDLDGAIGSEQSKTRPCVVIQNNAGNVHSPTLIVLPLTKETVTVQRLTCKERTHGVDWKQSKP